MDEERLKEVFLKRLYIEYELFKDSMLRKEKTDIFEESYRIETYKSLYQILIQKTAEMAETVLQRLAYQSNGVMEFFYQEWLKKEDSSHTELQEYVGGELLHGTRTGNEWVTSSGSGTKNEKGKKNRAGMVNERSEKPERKQK